MKQTIKLMILCSFLLNANAFAANACGKVISVYGKVTGNAGFTLKEVSGKETDFYSYDSRGAAAATVAASALAFDLDVCVYAIEPRPDGGFGFTSVGITKKI